MSRIYFRGGPLHQKIQEHPDPPPIGIIAPRLVSLPIMINGNYPETIDYQDVMYRRTGYLYEIVK